MKMSVRALLLAVVLVGCGPKPTAAPPTAVAPVASVPPVASALPPPKPAPKADVCKPPGTGEVSDDETPTIGGVQPKKVEPIAWLEARGVTKDVANAWYAKRFGVDAGLAETVFDNAPCWSVTLGDRSEEAIACEHELTYSWEQVRALVLVVRSKKIVPVLDLGLGMRALDWPGVRHLDLALVFDAGGRRADLRDRAPDGTVLANSRSSCREREAMLDACEEALRKETEPDPSCPIGDRTTGRPKVIRDQVHSSDHGTEDPVILHDCDQAREAFRPIVKEANTYGGALAKEAHAASAFVTKTCAERGNYVWKGDRFVRDRSVAASSNSSF